MKIYIDPGHGGDSIGASYKGRKEQDDTLRLSLRVRDLLLRQKDVEVKLSRSSSVNPLISERTGEANSWGADFFISIHRNAFTPNKAQGAEAWVYSKVEENGETFNKAKRINDLLCEYSGFVNRGTKRGAPSYTDFGVNRLSKMHSCLLEVGFIDSDADNEIFDTRFEDMARGIAQGLTEAVGLSYSAGDVIKGDVDGDGRVTSADARSVLRAAVGLEEVSLEAGDMDGDSKITAADAREILRKAVESEE